MSIEFQDSSLSSGQFNNFNQQSSGSAMVDFLIKNGVVKDAAAGNLVLVVGSLIFIAISIYIFIFGFSLPKGNQPQPTVPQSAAQELEL